MLNLQASPFRSQTPPRQRPPMVRSWPVVGAMPTVMGQQMRFLFDARERYGDIYTLRFGTLNVVVLNHPDHAQHVLRDHVQNYRKGGIFWEMMRGLFGNGILFTEGSDWLRHRRMLQPQFHRQRLATLTDAMVAAIDAGLSEWDPSSQHPTELTERLLTITASVILKTMFGSIITPAQLDNLITFLNGGVRHLRARILSTWVPAWLPVTKPGRGMQIHHTINAMIADMVGQSCAAEQAGQPVDNLISMLLGVVDDQTGEPMTDQQLRDEVISIILAGSETTAVGLGWVLYFLMQHPAHLERVRNEVDTVLGGRLPTWNDLPALRYTKQAIQETLRLRPPTWLLPRTAVADDLIDGYHIPANTMVALPLSVIHRHPSFWENPDVFDPERFAPPAAEGAAKRHACAWIPFGAGQRMCIGRDFAMMESQLVLAMLLQRFTLTPTTYNSPDSAALMRLRPRGVIEAYVARREH